MADLVLDFDPLNPRTRNARALVTPEPGEAINLRVLHRTSVKVLEAALIVAAATSVLEYDLRSATLVRPNDEQRRPDVPLSPMEQAQKFIHYIQALLTLTELQNRRHAGLAYLAPTRGQRLLHGHETSALVEIRNMWSNMANDERFWRDPLRVTHPKLWRRLDGQAETLMTLVDGDSVNVRWPTPAPAAVRYGAVRDRFGVRPEGGQHSETVSIRDRISAMEQANVGDEEKGWVLCRLGEALERAIKVANRSSRAARAVAVARDAFGEGEHQDSPASSVLSAVVSTASTGKKIASLAVALLRIEAEQSLLDFATRGQLSSNSEQLLERFNSYAGLSDSARTRLQAIFSEIDRDVAMGRPPRFTAAQSEAIRGLVRPRFVSGSAYTAALAVLSWIQFFKGLQPASPDATGLERFTQWGSQAVGGISAARATSTFIKQAGEIAVARDLVIKQSTVLGRYWGASGAIGVCGGIMAILGAVAEIDRGYDENNDFEVAVGGARMFAGALSILAIGFPALAPISTVVDLGIVAAVEIHRRHDEQLPPNLKFAKALCAEALALRGDGEDHSIAQCLGQDHGLHEFSNTTAPDAGIDFDGFWRPLCIGFDGEIDPQCSTLRDGLSNSSGSFAEEARERLTRVLGMLPHVEVHIDTLLFGGPIAGADPSQPSVFDLTSLTSPSDGGVCESPDELVCQ
jgi:hypothetical protein